MRKLAHPREDFERILQIFEYRLWRNGTLHFTFDRKQVREGIGLLGEIINQPGQPFAGYAAPKIHGLLFKLIDDLKGAKGIEDAEPAASIIEFLINAEKALIRESEQRRFIDEVSKALIPVAQSPNHRILQIGRTAQFRIGIKTK